MPSPAISAVVPVFNVERFLPAFLDSLRDQTLPLDEVELVFVNDGSTDRSADLIATWIERFAPTARLIDRSNGGLSSARNAGIEASIAPWITFPDPDDVLSRNYLGAVQEFVRSEAAQKVDLVVCKSEILHDATGEITNTHPLKFRFDKGDQIIDLERHPQYFHIQAASAFYRRERLDDLDLRFDELVTPNFEDGYLNSFYLGEVDRPRVAFLTGVLYMYRRRDDGSSLVQGSWAKPGKYLDVTRYGYLRLLEAASERSGGRVPRWIQNMVLYDLLWYFKQDDRIHSATGSIAPEITEEFHEIVTAIMRYIDVETIEDYRITPVSRELRQALLIGYKSAGGRPDRVHVARVDTAQQLAQVRYFYGGDLPSETFRSRGYEVEPVHAKSRSLTYFGRRIAAERIAWLPATGTLEVALDGRRLPVELGRQRQPRYAVTPTEMWGRLSDEPVPDPAHRRGATPTVPPMPTTTSLIVRRRLGVARRRLRGERERISNELRSLPDRVGAITRFFNDPDMRQQRADRRTMRRAHSGWAQQCYGHAWVLTDRNDQAQDNAEHLYRYLRDARPELNIWFVIDEGTPDWDRLRADGFKLVSYGTEDHTKLMLNCDHLISSQVDHYVVAPLDRKRFPGQKWRFTFLQHGVTKDDLSRWVNGKPIDVFVTATEPEFASIAGDGTPYTFTTREVKLTGFARHDRLWRLGSRVPVEERRLLLVMPTWRRELLGATIDGGNTRAPLPGFWQSDFARSWLDLVASDRLRDLARKHGLEIAYVPHPNMEVYLDVSSPVPDHVGVYRYRDVDIQDVFARGAIMVTDYSSNAFEMAFLGRPVVYYQFDRDQFFSGGHAYRRGNWSYDDDGFGPVATSADDAIDEIERIVKAGSVPADAYAARMDATFATRDENSCERVTSAIIESAQPVRYDVAYRRSTG